MVRVVALVGMDRTRKVIHHISLARVVWVAEGGPGWCSVKLAGADDNLIVAEPAAELAKRLATTEQAEAVA